VSPESPLRHGNEPDFELIETLRWEPGSGFLRAPFHIERLLHSAKALGFDADPMALGAILEHIPKAEQPLRIRLAMSRAGDVDVEGQKFTPAPPGTVWRLAVARTRLWSADSMLRHKTTRRRAYDAARAEFPRELADEVLLLNERSEVCEGTITNLFLDMGDGGPLRTPALSCGLLPGILRAELLEEGGAVESVLTMDDVRRAAKIYVGNSLRGLIEARLAG
jgi:4-amino-4-deoxychorismate lyase